MQLKLIEKIKIYPWAFTGSEPCFSLKSLAIQINNHEFSEN